LRGPERTERGREDRRWYVPGHARAQGWHARTGHQSGGQQHQDNEGRQIVSQNTQDTLDVPMHTTAERQIVVGQAGTAPDPRWVIVTRGIKREYDMGGEIVRALRGVDLAIGRNEYVAIMGPSGSGKSTLMNIVGCLDTPSAGEYWLNGTLVSSMTDDQLAR